MNNPHRRLLNTATLLQQSQAYVVISPDISKTVFDS